jgi:hypothetical protein
MSVPLTAGSGKPSIDAQGRLIVKGTFAGTPHGQLVRQLVNEGHVWQASVTYLEHKQPGGRVKREVLNGTFTGVPANPNAVVLNSKSFKGEANMSSVFEERMEALNDGVQRALADLEADKISQQAFDKIMTDAETESAKLAVQVKSFRRARQFSAPHEDGGNPDPAVQQQQPAPYADFKFKGLLNEHGKNPYAPSPLHASQQQWVSLFEACEQQLPSFAVNLKAFGAQDTMMHPGGGTRMKAPNFSVEGTPGSLLPPQLIPQAFPLLMEKTRVFSHLPGMPMDSQWIQYLQHSSNSNPAAVHRRSCGSARSWHAVHPEDSHRAKAGRDGRHIPRAPR